MRFLCGSSRHSSIVWLMVAIWNLNYVSCSSDESYLVWYKEVEHSYIEYSSDANSQSLLLAESHEYKVTVHLLSFVDDLVHPLFYLVKGIVRRLDKQLLPFEPFYYITDGHANGCRVVDSHSGEEIANPDCQQNCTNFGRYCATTSPLADPLFSAKVSGASMVEEILRRRCGEFCWAAVLLLFSLCPVLTQTSIVLLQIHLA